MSIMGCFASIPMTEFSFSVFQALKNLCVIDDKISLIGSFHTTNDYVFIGKNWIIGEFATLSNIDILGK